MHISYSELKAYWLCPARYKHRVDGDPARPDIEARAFIGNLLMKVAEAFYVKQWWRDPGSVYTHAQAALAMLAPQIQKQYNPQWPDGKFEEQMALAKVAVPVIIETIRGERLLGVKNLAEYEMTLPIREHVVHGRGDFVIVHKDGTITLLDGKGGSSDRYVDLDQLRLYSEMVKHGFGKLPTRVGFWFFRLGRVAWKTITAKARLKTLDKVGAALVGIEREQFETTPGSHCRLCDWRHLCKPGQDYLVAKAGGDVPMEVPGGIIETSF